jgi:hypothetical protein
MKNLIIPVAGQSSRFPNMRPKWLMTMPDGLLMLEKSISKFDLSLFDRVYVVALKEHIEKYTNKNLLIKSLKKNISKNLELVILKKQTCCPTETIINLLKIKKISGSILIKDCDNQFSIPENDLRAKNLKNSIYAINVNNLDLIDAKNKSYIQTNNNGSVINIIEKSVISNLFCCGAYCFENVDDFYKYGSQLLKKSKNVFISHIILKMILEGNEFKFKKAFHYSDWGTWEEFKKWKERYLTIFCDFDGCLVNNGSKFGKIGWKTSSISNNLMALKKLQEKKKIHLLITTSRPKSEIPFIKKILKKYSIMFKTIITDLPHSKRLLVNDFADTNPYPTAISLNTERDSLILSRMFKELS